MDRDTVAADLLMALRILEANGIVDFNGHASVRLNDGCLINSGGSVRSRLSETDLVETDTDGKSRPGTDAAPIECHIHTEIYRARPDVGAVVHGHPTWPSLLASTDMPFHAVYPQGAVLGSIPLHPSPLSINSAESGKEVARLLGSGCAVLLRAHGVVVAGRDIREATIKAIYLEENARRQCLAAAMRQTIGLTAEDAETCRISLDRPALLAKAWDYFACKLPKTAQTRAERL